MKEMDTLVNAVPGSPSSRFSLIFCLVFAALPSIHVLGQQKPNFSITDATEGSDWRVRFQTSGAATGMDCWGNDNYSYDVIRNGVKLSTVALNGTPLGTYIDVPLGPDSAEANWSFTYKTNGSLFSCLYWKNSNTARAGTVRLKPPKNVDATDSTSEAALRNQIVLTWQKGTNAPDNVHHYWIFKDGDFSAPVKHVPATEPLRWTDTDAKAGEKHTYSVVTWISSSTWGHHYSDTVTVEGSTYNGFTATDGTLSGSVELRWNNMHPSATSVKIFREGEEIHTRTDMNQTPVYKDTDRVPGLKYNYTIVPYHNGVPYATFADTGFAKRNGRINGSVKAPLGGPVQGAIVIAERYPEPLIDQGAENPLVYRDTTDANGFFAITDIYYGTRAEFKVHVEKGDHEFNPSSYEQIELELEQPTFSTSLQFVDISSFTVKGKITQKLKKDQAAVEGVEILVNDLYKGTKSDAEGNFALTVEEIGDYTISTRFQDHAFSPEDVQLHIDTDVADVNFEDVERDTLSGYFSGGCNIYIGKAKLRIYNTRNPIAGIDTTFWTNEGSG
ncbi:MAG: hypothetical protein M3Y60_06490, partial [Bacteroidota bacterium]|nr:hypothetical protein [Bacteroidota bacterium]